MEYLLMNMDTPVAEIRAEKQIDDYSFSFGRIFESYLPYGAKENLTGWVSSRHASKHRREIENLMREMGIHDAVGFIDMTRALSLNDTFWIRKADSEECWSDVSLYTNPFDEVMANIAFDGAGMLGASFSTTSPEFGTSGHFQKCWVREDDRIKLVKRGTWHGKDTAANEGTEPYCEALATQLYQAVLSPDRFVRYDLTVYRGQLATQCDLFTSEEVGFVPFFAACRKPVNNIADVLDFYRQYGLEEQARIMFVLDAVLFNEDRHAGNHGLLVNNDTGEVLGVAPYFDLNLSLLPYMMEDDDPSAYGASRHPAIGTGFVSTAKALLDKETESMLRRLRDFKFINPGCACPDWRIEKLNQAVIGQVDRILS